MTECMSGEPATSRVASAENGELTIANASKLLMATMGHIVKLAEDEDLSPWWVKSYAETRRSFEAALLRLEDRIGDSGVRSILEGEPRRE